MATCPMCNVDDVNDDPNDMTGHDISKHPETSENSEEGSASE